MRSYEARYFAVFVVLHLGERGVSMREGGGRLYTPTWGGWRRKGGVNVNAVAPWGVLERKAQKRSGEEYEQEVREGQLHSACGRRNVGPARVGPWGGGAGSEGDGRARESEGRQEGESVGRAGGRHIFCGANALWRRPSASAAAAVRVQWPQSGAVCEGRNMRMDGARVRTY